MDKREQKLEYYEKLLNETIIKNQDPITSLIPSLPNTLDAWVRDNCYAVLSIWALSLAYKKSADQDDDKTKTYELEQKCVKLMRALLTCFLKQKDKLEKFKYSQNSKDSFHAKYNAHTCDTIVEDLQWGHLQIDAVSLYLLILAQLTSSGMQIIFTLDEVSFIQNMVFYIEEAYRIADYGIWERGQKTNQGLPELNSSSIGMAKAALESLNELDLFGATGGPQSIIHCVAGESHQCEIVLESMLPRESNSKEIDSAILFILGFPAFAIDSKTVITHTKQMIIDKLQGKYGFKRFLRDGYKTALEDVSRLYYDPLELRTFENIECEWPMFFALMKIDAIFQGNQEQLKFYNEALEKVMIVKDGYKYMPELYTVPVGKVRYEYENPHTQEREPAGKFPTLIGQSLYLLSCLLEENLVAVGELDPLNRRLFIEPKPELVVQVVVVTDDDHIKDEILRQMIPVQTIQEIYPIEVHPSRILTKIYSYLGVNKKLRLSGRPLNETFLLSTCKLYSLEQRLLAFTSHYLDQSEFYMASDQDLFVDMFKMLLGLLSNSWKEVGRPTMLLFLQKTSLNPSDNKLARSIVTTLTKLKDGYLGGVRVQIGHIKDFVSTSCITNVTWLVDPIDTVHDSHSVLETILGQGRTAKPQLSPAYEKGQRPSLTHWSNVKHYAQFCRGLVKRTKSISVDRNEANIIASRARKDKKTLLDLPSPLIQATSVAMATTPNTDSQKKPLLSPIVDSPHILQSSANEADRYSHFSEWKDNESSAYHNKDLEELQKMLLQSESLNEQADIIHFLYITKGADYVVKKDGESNITVNDLLQELYDKTCHTKQWWLVRHTAGLLRKRVDNLSKIVTDLLVHQKQVTIGLPPEPREKIISHPLPPDKLRDLINEAYGDDYSSAMLTQELLVYLSILISTEPSLFKEILRVRTGLILQVMASELARILECSGEEASDHLLNLSPYELKTILYNILSGREFNIGSSWVAPNQSIAPLVKEQKNINELKLLMKKRISSHIGILGETKESRADIPLHGQWLRRRRLDGSLNRVPVNFYSSVWKILEKCHAFNLANQRLDNNLIKEMTPEEIKFSLHIESILNILPHSEYRQLVVEALCALIVVTDKLHKYTISQLIDVDHIVHRANQIFLNDQKQVNGDATLCCAPNDNTGTQHENATVKPCGGVDGICQFFYDSAPSGVYGTLTYMTRAFAEIVRVEALDERAQCHIN